MSLEAWGDEGDAAPEGYVSEDQAQEMFIAGLQAMREMLARFVEQGGDTSTAQSLRANWNPQWGPDPGKPERIIDDGLDDPYMREKGEHDHAD